MTNYPGMPSHIGNYELGTLNLFGDKLPPRVQRSAKSIDNFFEGAHPHTPEAISEFHEHLFYLKGYLNEQGKGNTTLYQKVSMHTSEIKKGNGDHYKTKRRLPGTYEFAVLQEFGENVPEEYLTIAREADYLAKKRVLNKQERTDLTRYIHELQEYVVKSNLEKEVKGKCHCGPDAPCKKEGGECSCLKNAFQNLKRFQSAQ